jgi:hypothetical protein
MFSCFGLNFLREENLKFEKIDKKDFGKRASCTSRKLAISG